MTYKLISTNYNLMDLALIDLTLVPVVVGLVHVAKKTGLSSRYAPLLSLVLGLVGVWVLKQDIQWIAGIVVGLSASGLWSGAKASLK